MKGFRKDATTASNAPTGIVKITPRTAQKKYGFRKGQKVLYPLTKLVDTCSSILSRTIMSFFLLI